MKTKEKMKEFKGKSLNELKNDLEKKREEARKLRFDISAKQVKNSRQLRQVKKDIARLLTLVKEKS
jgi:large subunit ribosomal protein L29